MEPKVNRLLENIHATREDIGAVFGSAGTHSVITELDAWRDIRPHIEQGNITFAHAQIDDANEQLAVIRDALARKDIEHFVAASEAAARKLGGIARADAVLPGEPGTILHLPGEPGAIMHLDPAPAEDPDDEHRKRRRRTTP